MNVLLVVWDGGGNVPPFVGVGRELVNRGHRVLCVGPERLRPSFEPIGVTFTPIMHGAPFDPLEPMSLGESQRAQGEVFLGPGYGLDVEAAVAAELPDVTLIDCFLVSAQASAERLGLRFAVLCHVLPGWFVPFWDGVLLPTTKAVRVRAGVSAVESLTEVWARAARVLVTSVGVLDVEQPRLRELGNVRYVGPVAPAVDGALAAPTASHPLVLVSFSTTALGQGEPLRAVIVALAGLPVRAVVTAGPSLDVASLPTAANVDVRAWIPHGSVMPLAPLVVTHGGLGTVSTALAHGVPLLCMPLGRDQGFVSDRVAALGAGLKVAADSEPAELRRGIMSVLTDGQFRAAARRVAEVLEEAGDGAVNVAHELEGLAGR